MSEKSICQRRREFLDDTVAYYSEDPAGRRARLGEVTCLYRTNDGRKCAIGRHIPDEKYDKSFEGLAAMTNMTEVPTGREEAARKLIDAIPSDVKELGDGFLGAVQQLHDFNRYWATKGLSVDGEARRQLIIRIYCTPNEGSEHDE